MVKATSQAFVFDSGSGAIAKVNGQLLLEGMHAPSEYLTFAKAYSDPKSVGSKRLRDKYGITLDGVICAARPFDFSLYAYAVSLNTYHCRCVRQKAMDIGGAPWKITGDVPDAKRQEIVAFFDGLFDDGRDLNEGLEIGWTDYEALGNEFVEVIPDVKGDPGAAIANIPATEMWMRLDDLGFVQAKNGTFRHFRRHGVDIEKYDNLPANDPLSTNAPKKGDDGGPTSIWHNAQYFPWSQYYGIPSIMPAWNRMALSVLECEYNLAFFNNNAIPDYAVILEGSWADDIETTIRDYFQRHLKGKAHKTLALKVADGSKITFEKLTGDNAKEGSFRLLRQDCRDEVLHAHGMPPIKIGIMTAGRLGNGNDEQNQQYKDSHVTPGRKKLTTFLNHLLQLRFPGTKAVFEFEPYDTDDAAANATIDQIYLQDQVLSPGEVRTKRFPELPFRPGSDQPLPYKAGAPTDPDSSSGNGFAGLQKLIEQAIEEARAV